MPDIFGLGPLDYRHLQDMHEAGPQVLEGYLNQQAQGALRRRHSFEALQRFANAEAEPIGYMTDNLQAIQAMVEETLYTDFRLDDFVPIITNIPEGAKTYSYRVMDRVGQGRFIDNDGSNAPSANVSLTAVPYTLEYAGIVPEWTIEDVRSALFGGVALDNETVMAATTGSMDHIELVGLKGDSPRGFKGLVNQLTTGSNGVNRSEAAATIDSMTGDEIVEFLQAEVTTLITSSAEVFGRSIRSGLSIYLPLEQGAIVANKRLTDIERTAWEYFAEHNLWYSYTGERPALKLVSELKGGGRNGSDRMIVGLKNDRVMEMAMPIPPRVIGMYDRGYTISAPMEYKISGLNLKRPTGVRYIDGI